MEWIDIIQAPYSIYDQRIMLESNRLKEGIQRGEIELHARSIYLQGIILQKAEKLPSIHVKRNESTSGEAQYMQKKTL